MQLSRVIEGGHGEPDFLPITSKPAKQDFSEYSKEIEEALRDLKIPLNQPQPTWKEFHPSMKKGPNGQALISSIEDAWALKDDPQLLRDILRLSGNRQLAVMISLCQTVPVDKWVRSVKGETFKPKNNLRKLASILDPECKVRIIAILDYWSQTVLKPLHDNVMRMLRNLPADRTYQQVSPITVTPNAH